MTKAQELARIDGLIASLGKDTYIGPFLIETRGFLEQCIKSDIFPEINLRERAEKVEKMRQEAAAEREFKIEKATKEAEKIVEDARRQAQAIRANAKRALENAAASL